MAEKQEKRGRLQVEEDRPWQETLWSAQRVGWALMALLIFAALLGALGKGGPFASASARSPAAVIEYPRITRWQSNEQVTVRLPPSASGEVDVELSRAFVELFSVESIEPDPSEVQATGAGHRFTFNVENGGGDKLVVFHVKAGTPALKRTIHARIGDAPPTEMRLTVLP